MQDRIRSFILVSVAGLSVTAPAIAQEGGLEEIIVTAQKRSESLQITPISMQALSESSLENRGIHDITDLRSSVPALQVTPHPSSAATARVFMRGVGYNDDQITSDPSVAIYLDGVYLARSQGLAGEVAELERIEVLRGPQGALYGRNATGGAINYITRAPELGVFSGRQTFTVGNYDQFRSRTRVNVPVGDTLAVELGYLHAQKDGFVKNLGTGVSRFGDLRRDAYRGAAHWQPSDVVDIRYAYDRSEINDTPAFAAAVPFYPRIPDRPTAGSVFVRDLQRNDITTQGHNLTASWDLTDTLTLKSITGYRRLHNRTYQDSFAGVLGPFDGNIASFNQKQKQVSEELQAVGKAMDGRLDYVLGAFYFDEKANSFDATRPPIASLPGTDRTVTINNKAYALFGQATFRPEIVDGLYVTGGVRWSRDQRKATLQQITRPGGSAAITGPLGNGDRSFSNVSPSFVVGYSPSDALNVYAKYARGYKTGGYNVRATTIARFNAGYGEETLNSYELGVKSSWLDNRLRLNAAVFQSDYNDIQTSVQVSATNPALVDVFNAGKARIRGVEAELTARPVQSVTVGLNYAYLDAKYRKIEDLSGADITSRYTYIEAPKQTLSASVEYTMPETAIGVPSIYLDYYYQSRKHTATGDARYIVGSYGLLNGRLTLSDIPASFGNWRLSAFAKNMTNKTYYIAHYQGLATAAVYGDPRTYGLELTVQF